MGISNTPPKPDIPARSQEQLLEDLDISLREAARMKTADAFAYVKEIHSELNRRSISVTDFLHELSRKTNWEMNGFLQECLSYPLVEPQITTRDGVRLDFRCWQCNKNERYDENGIGWCNECIEQAINAIRAKNGDMGYVLYTTLTTDKRCHHAGDQTLMLMVDHMDFWETPYCEECLLEEKKRRGG
jgi:hypothetical protein